MVEALLSAGLSIQGFREYPYSPLNCFAFLEERKPGQWWVKDLEVAIPITLSLHAVRRA